MLPYCCYLISLAAVFVDGSVRDFGYFVHEKHDSGLEDLGGIIEVVDDDEPEDGHDFLSGDQRIDITS